MGIRKVPKVKATLPLSAGTVDVYATAQRWTPSHILVSWQDDGDHPHWAWIPAGNARRVSDSEGNIEEYRRGPENLRQVQWGNRLPGFLPVQPPSSVPTMPPWASSTYRRTQRRPCHPYPGSWPGTG